MQDKIFKVIEIIESFERVPTKYLMAITGSDGLFEEKSLVMETKSWKNIKDDVYGKKGTERRDELERDFQAFKIGLLLRQARKEKNLTQQELGELIHKKRTYISRVENNGSNLTLKTLYEIVEKGLGGKVKISIEV